MPVARWDDPYSSHEGHNLYTNLLESDLNYVNNPTTDTNILSHIFTTRENVINEMNVGHIFQLL